jgi:hypothetical protein
MGVFFCAAIAVLGGVSAVLADSGANHQALQARPISLGTSGGNINDISTLYCCSGTLGSLVQDGAGTQYILSNDHVLARGNLGAVGDPVNQPGMIDQSCLQNGIVANLSAFVPIQFATKTSTPLNQVDAAIAQVTSGSVRTDGAILDVGTLSASTMSAFVNQGVQKSGRTTGRTSGTVSAIDVTVDVGYSSSCGGAATKKARYVNQISITPGAFSAGGDSGSLIVENGTVNPADGLPRAVGLLFAGSSSSTIANPIGPVLALLGVEMVGGTPPTPPATGSVSGVVTSAADSSPIAGATVSASTGQSTLTNASGAYTLSSVPTGTRTITASAVGFLSASLSVSVLENATSAADFSLSVAVVPTTVGVGCVTYTTTGGRNRDLRFTVRALDNFGNPVAGAQVNISVNLNGSLFGTGTGATTNSNGQASYTSKNAPNGTYTTTVTNIIAPGLTFNSGSTPPNSFRKGTDASPSSFCNSGATPSDAVEGLETQVSRARAAKARNSDRLLGIPGVQGHGVALDATGRPVIEVYLANENAAARAQIPATIENIPVRVVVTGEFKAY